MARKIYLIFLCGLGLWMLWLRRDPWPSLQAAVQAGDAEQVQQLIDAGANVNSAFNSSRVFGRERIPWTPLCTVVDQGNYELVKLLLENGASASLEANCGNFEAPALHSAVWNDDKDIAELLLVHGANIEATDKGGFTPLMYAAMSEWTSGASMAKLLISHGADINAMASMTALHLAVIGRKVELIQLLIASGADVNARDKKGFTPLDIAQNSFKEVIDQRCSVITRVLTDSGAVGIKFDKLQRVK